MSGIFNPNGWFYKLLVSIYQVIILNCCFVLFSIPIITIGANITALYSCFFKLNKGESRSNLFKFFVQELRKNFKEATLLWFGLLAFLGLSILIYPLISKLMLDLKFLNLLFIIILTIILLALGYLFPLVARFENKPILTLVNSFRMSFENMAASILILVINGGLIVMFPIYLPKLFFVWLVTAIALAAFLNSQLIEKVFNRYRLEDDEVQKV